MKIKEKIKEKSEVNCFPEICENLYIKKRSNIQYSIANQLRKSKTAYEDKKNQFGPFKKYTIYFMFWIRSKIKDQACSSRMTSAKTFVPSDPAEARRGQIHQPNFGVAAVLVSVGV